MYNRRLTQQIRYLLQEYYSTLYRKKSDDKITMYTH